jgi:protein phosphatase
MELTYAQVSVPGPVRSNNEDYLGFWQPDTPEDRREIGAVALIADGVGGRNRGEVASALAVQSALDVFCTSDPDTEPRKVIRQAFDLASRTVYDDSIKNPAEGQMCTTLTMAVFRYNEVTIGFAGDTRAYLVRRRHIEQLTTDHNQVAAWAPNQFAGWISPSAKFSRTTSSSCVRMDFTVLRPMLKSWTS